MHDRRRLAALGVIGIAIISVLAACTGPAGARPAGSTAPVAASGAEPAATAGGSTAAGSPSADARVTPAAATASPAVELTQAWATAELRDVSSGDTFRIADHAGKVIIVETMAIWCSNCRTQQTNVEAALAQLPADRVVYVVLDVDPNESGNSLAAYREQNGFRGRYAIAGSDVARGLAAEFGDQFLSPPSTPIVIIGTDGTVTRTDFGQKSTDQIIELARAHGA